MSIPVPIPASPLTVSNAENASAETLLAIFAQLMGYGTAGAGITTPPFLVPVSPNPTTTAPVLLDTAEKQLVVRQLCLAVTAQAQRLLINFIDEGPANGFDSPCVKLTTGTVFPTQNLWKRADGSKLVQQNITWSGPLPTTIVWTLFALDGATALCTVTDTISYTNVFESSRVRTIV